MSQVVANRYAEALFRLARDKGLLSQVDRDLSAVHQAVSENQDLRSLLEHPLVAKADKSEMVRRLFSGRIEPLTLNFLQLLQDRGRGSVLAEVSSRFRRLLAKHERRTTAKLQVAHHPGDEAVERLRAELEGAWAVKVDLEVAVEPSLLAGARLRVDDQVLDGSLRARLDGLRQQLLRP
ncbi:MAG: ATP synthase F1 subunit delta [Candidatus Sericytochromatia bacterium]|nr:ATP synthase F1 subunit delta [Candidatus Sericytochromatia bacterium]